MSALRDPEKDESPKALGCQGKVAQGRPCRKEPAVEKKSHRIRGRSGYIPRGEDRELRVDLHCVPNMVEGVCSQQTPPPMLLCSGTCQTWKYGSKAVLGVP